MTRTYGTYTYVPGSTPRVLNTVTSNPNVHVLIRANDPRANIIWDGSSESPRR